jgi:aspartate/methionine/tyrosine aminotransferase
MSDEVLYNADVFITPGGIFGSAGEQYVRISLCSDVKNLTEAISRVTRMKELVI